MESPEKSSSLLLSCRCRQAGLSLSGSQNLSLLVAKNFRKRGLPLPRMAITSKREIQLQKFNEIYNKLNTAQKQAVDTIEGPVMVIAGPGTGKTQILGARIGKILLDTDTQPDNIL